MQVRSSRFETQTLRFFPPLKRIAVCLSIGFFTCDNQAHLAIVSDFLQFFPKSKADELKYIAALPFSRFIICYCSQFTDIIAGNPVQPTAAKALCVARHMI